MDYDTTLKHTAGLFLSCSESGDEHVTMGTQEALSLNVRGTLGFHGDVSSLHGTCGLFLMILSDFFLCCIVGPLLYYHTIVLYYGKRPPIVYELVTRPHLLTGLFCGKQYIRDTLQ